MKNMKRYALSVMGIGLVFLLFACSGSKKTVATNPKLDELIASKNFVFEASRVEPFATRAMNQIAMSGLMRPGDNANRVDVGGQNYTLAIKGEAVTANLPYYGERQIGGGYNLNGDVGYTFEDTLREWDVKKSAVGSEYDIDFRTNQGNESLNVQLMILPNGKAGLTINSSQRNVIRYYGTVREHQE